MSRPGRDRTYALVPFVLRTSADARIARDTLRWLVEVSAMGRIPCSPACAVLGIVVGSAAGAQGVRVNLPLPRPPGFQAEDTFAFRASSDGRWVVYLADDEVDDLFELYGVPSDGSAPARKLNGPIVPGGHIVEVVDEGWPPQRRYEPPDLRTSAAHVAYRADLETDGVYELFSAPLDGGAQAVKLNGTLAPGERVEQLFAFVQGGERVVYLAFASASYEWELCSAPADGSAAPVHLTGALRSFGSALGNSPQLLVTPDGETVVYCAIPASGMHSQLYAASVDGSAPPRRLAGWGTYSMALSPDGSSVVYLRWDSSRIHLGLWTVPVDASAAPRQLDQPSDIGGVADFAVSPDSSRVAYRADYDVGYRYELWSVPLDGSGFPLRLHQPFGNEQSVGAFAFSTDAARVVYVADVETDGVDELFSVRAEGSTQPVKLSPTPVPGGGVAGAGTEYLFQVGAERAVWIADAATDELFELFSAPLDGSAPAVRLNSPLIPDGDVSGGGAWAFRIAPDGLNVVYRADARIDEMHELWLVPADGSAAAARLSGPSVIFGSVAPNSPFGESFAFTPDGARVLYRADEEIDERFDLWSVRLDDPGRPERLDPELDPGRSGQVGEFAFGAGGRLVYSDGRVFALELGSPRVEGFLPFAQLGSGADLLAGPDGSRVAFLEPEPRYYSEYGPAARLRCAPVDGSAPAAHLNAEWGGMPETLRFTSDGGHIVFDQEFIADPRWYGGLFSAPSDGSAPQVSLTEPPGMVENQRIFDFRISPDGARVVYTKYEYWFGYVLVSVPLDRSAEPVRLAVVDWPPPAFELTDDSTRAVFVDVSDAGASELRSVPLDASAPPVLLHAPLATGRRVQGFRPIGDRVVAVADLEEADVFELWSFPLDPARGETIVRLSDKGVPGGDVSLFELSPDRTRALYLADDAADDVRELWSVALDGRTAPVRLNAPVAAGENVSDSRFLLAEDVRRVVFAVESELGPARLFSAPLDGGEPAVALWEELVAGGDLWRFSPAGTIEYSFAISPDGHHVAYWADALTDEDFELFLVPTAGGRARRLNAPLVPGGDVRLARSEPPRRPFAFSPDGRSVAYQADQITDEVVELFLTPVDLPRAGRAGPPR